MTAISQFSEQSIRLLWAVSWQASILIALVAALALCFRKATASFRYWLLCVPLFRLCLPVGLETPIGLADSVRRWFAPIEQRIEIAPLSTHVEPHVPAPTLAPAQKTVEHLEFSPMTAPRAAAMDARGALALAWLGIATAFAALIVFRAIRAGNQIRRLPLLERADLLAALNDLSSRMNVHQRVEMRIATGSFPVAGPMVAGAAKPTLILPSAMAEEWPLAQIEPVLAHELAHIRRRDLLVNYLQIAVQTVFFFHPLVWWLNWRIRREREWACDDLAVDALGGKRGDYGRSILRVLEEAKRGFAFATIGIGMAEPRHSLGRRIVRIMDHNYRAHRKIGVSGTAIVTALGLMCLAIAADRGMLNQGESAMTESSSKTAAVRESLKMIGTALEAYHVDWEAFPTKTHQLTTPIHYIAKIPADPYDATSELRYQRLGAGQRCVIYSVGPDGRDDRGDLAKDIATFLPNPVMQPWSLESLEIVRTATKGESVEYNLEKNLANAYKLQIKTDWTDQEATIDFTLIGQDGRYLSDRSQMKVPLKDPGNIPLVSTNILLPNKTFCLIEAGVLPEGKTARLRARISFWPKEPTGMLPMTPANAPLGFGPTCEDDEKVLAELRCAHEIIRGIQGKLISADPKDAASVKQAMPGEAELNRIDQALLTAHETTKGKLGPYSMSCLGTIFQWNREETDSGGVKHLRSFSYALPFDTKEMKWTNATAQFKFSQERSRQGRHEYDLTGEPSITLPFKDGFKQQDIGVKGDLIRLFEASGAISGIESEGKVTLTALDQTFTCGKLAMQRDDKTGKDVYRLTEGAEMKGQGLNIKGESLVLSPSEKSSGRFDVLENPQGKGNQEKSPETAPAQPTR